MKRIIAVALLAVSGGLLAFILTRKVPCPNCGGTGFEQVSVGDGIVKPGGPCHRCQPHLADAPLFSRTTPPPRPPRNPGGNVQSNPYGQI